MRRLSFVLALVVSIALVACSAPHRPTVASAVLFDGQSQAAYDFAVVERIANDEISHLSNSGIALPPLTLVVVAPLAQRAFTVVSAEPVRYTVVVYRYAYVDERQVRFSTSHEIGHVVAVEAGVPSTEAIADAFARCFGSVKAREFAEANGRGDGVNCEELRRALLIED